MRVQIAFFMLMLASCSLGAGAPQVVTFDTNDGVTIHADWYPARISPAPALILLHMNRKDRTTWADFAVQANDSGFSALAIDFRGHGESTHSMLKELNAADFSNLDYANFIQDLKSAVEWVRHSVEPSANGIAIVGASIGANVAINYAMSDSLISAVVMVSPGLNYRDVLTEPAVKSYANRPVMMMAAEDDNYSYVTCRTLDLLAGSHKETVYYESGGHGTYLLASRPEAANAILHFLRENLHTN